MATSIAYDHWAKLKLALDAARSDAAIKHRLWKASEDFETALAAEEFEAFCMVPESERDPGFSNLPDNVIYQIQRDVLRQSRSHHMPMSWAFALTCKAWARVAPKPPHTHTFTGLGLMLRGRTLLLPDRAVDVKTHAVLASFEGTTPSISPDGGTLVVYTTEGLVWRSLRNPPHHAPGSLPTELLPFNGGDLIASSVPGIMLCKNNKGVVDARKEGPADVVHLLPGRGMVVEVDDGGFFLMCREYKLNYTTFKDLKSRRHVVDDTVVRDVTLLCPSPNRSLYVEHSEHNNKHCFAVHQAIDGACVDWIEPDHVATSRTKWHYKECSIDDDGHVYVLFAHYKGPKKTGAQFSPILTVFSNL